MSEGSTGAVQEATTAQQNSLRTVTMVIYALYGVAIIFGITSIVGVIMAHIKSGDARDTIYASHMSWLIRTFWISFAGGLIGSMLTLVGIGFLVLLAVAIWYIYRIVVGFLKLNDGKAIENPSRLF
ncbi:putative transmembrane protein [Caenispirillum salinarum AK4]|uniref:Putative transmembrane protein n=1 Tax=Caenispirillum salinarum AK4 TaxID=1238182 RepID=K9H5W8_9PROT|nr:putative transmembrane protein [Caenispirillum salinarum]EKV32494.1 putative transmembrane protein [Caenispirillum salinarum AK4]